MVGTMTCWRCGGIKRNTWKGYVCPNCAQIKAIKNQTKAMTGRKKCGLLIFGGFGRRSN